VSIEPPKLPKKIPEKKEPSNINEKPRKKVGISMIKKPQTFVK
jgi:hypothetical protein